MLETINSKVTKLERFNENVIYDMAKIQAAQLHVSPRRSNGPSTLLNKSMNNRVLASELEFGEAA